MVPPLFATLVARAASAGVLLRPHSVTGVPGRFYCGRVTGSSNCSEVFSASVVTADLAPIIRSLGSIRRLPVLVHALRLL